MAEDGSYDVRKELLQLLLNKVSEDNYPSVTMLDQIEQLLAPEDVPAYARVLMEKIGSENYPSLDMIRRVYGFVG